MGVLQAHRGDNTDILFAGWVTCYLYKSRNLPPPPNNSGMASLVTLNTLVLDLCMGPIFKARPGPFIFRPGPARRPVADPAMGGQGGRPPIDQNLGLAMAARLRHGGKFSLKSLTFDHFFV